MNSKPTERCLKVTEADAMAAVERDDYQWLVDNLFIPALVDIIIEDHTAALVKGSTLPRSRRPAGTRRHRNNRTRRSHEFRP
jgi:hypothetical protein